ncbi:MAG TPA: hypothetical protein DIC19_04565 [Erysipelotrichaceae bacterium]|nr:hypothetical protein [Erysipelotrichaceae bacterium]
MDSMQLVVLYFIYGLAFFSMGLSCFFLFHKHMDFPFRRSLLHLGFFGLIHGFAEWLIMFNRIPMFREYNAQLSITILFLYGSSFYFLSLFAFYLIPTIRKFTRIFISILTLFYGLWWMGVLFVMADYAFDVQLIREGLILFTRYVTALPAGIFATFALLFYQRELRIAKLNTLSRILQILALVFFLYTLSTGLVGEAFDFFPARFINRDAFIHQFGLPIEMFRILFALGIALSLFVFMFTYERQQRLHEKRLFQQQVSRVERRKLGSQLHDVVLQHLFVANLSVTNLESKGVDPDILHTLHANIQLSMEDIRSFLKSPVIRSVDLSEFKSELEHIFSTDIDSALRVDFNFDVPMIYTQPIDSQAMNHLLYIIKEFLINTKKHAKATRFECTIIGDPEAMNITLLDNGHGFKLDEVDQSQHFGLNSIKNRIEMCLGTYHWNTIGKTRLDLRVPWKGLIYDEHFNRG